MAAAAGVIGWGPYVSCQTLLCFLGYCNARYSDQTCNGANASPAGLAAVVLVGGYIVGSQLGACARYRAGQAGTVQTDGSETNTTHTVVNPLAAVAKNDSVPEPRDAANVPASCSDGPHKRVEGPFFLNDNGAAKDDRSSCAPVRSRLS